MASGLKKIMRHPFIQWIFSGLAAFYIWLVFHTSRFEEHDAQIPQGFWKENQPFILAFWHGRLLMIPPIWARRKSFYMLISAHRDGLLIARTISLFGLKNIPGSKAKAGKKDKGGADALRKMLRHLKEGDCVGITPDGPRGPRETASEGVVQLARLSQVPIIPVAFNTRHKKYLNTWDRFLLPRPFTRGVFIWGDPLFVSKDEDVDKARQRIEEGLKNVTHRADHLMRGDEQ